MSSALFPVFAAMVLFQAKHFLCDFALQTQNQVQSKGIYGAFGGVGHAGLHAIGSIPALLFLTRSPQAIAIVLLVEFVVHYHVDWSKARIDSRYGWTDQDRRYWIVFGLDQLIHQLTYAGFIYALAG